MSVEFTAVNDSDLRTTFHLEMDNFIDMRSPETTTATTMAAR
jgi:hypothetical protein